MYFFPDIADKSPICLNLYLLILSYHNSHFLNQQIKFTTMKKIITSCLALCLMGLTTILTAQNTVYVSTSGSDSNDGLSALTPVRTFAYAVSIANAGTNFNEIVLAPGTYEETVTADLSTANCPNLLIRGESAKTTIIKNNIPSIYFSDNNTGYAIGLQTTSPYINSIIKTNDGGTTWTNYPLGSTSTVSSKGGTRLIASSDPLDRMLVNCLPLVGFTCISSPFEVLPITMPSYTSMPGPT